MTDVADWSRADVISAFALVVSLLAVGLSFNANRRLNKAILRGRVIDTPDFYGYSVTNHGTGPAQLFSVEYFIDSKPVDAETLKEEIRNYLSSLGVAFQLNTTLPGGMSALSPGETIDLLAVQFLPQEYKLRKGLDPSRFRVRIGYESSLGGKEYFDSGE